MITNLNTFCTMRISPHTTERKLREFIYYLFEGEFEQYLMMELLEQFRLFQAENLYGRLSYSITTGKLEIKEDNLRL